MKQRRNAVKTTSYIAGIFAIMSALMVMVLLIMSAVGFLYPRKEKIILHTDTFTKTYDTTPLEGGHPTVTYGSLRPGHKLVVTSVRRYTNVGEYKNDPTYIIVDASGAEVTDMYDIQTDFGNIIIKGIPITVRCDSKSKRYDGIPLVSNKVYINQDLLADGHSFICDSTTSITEPGKKQILPSYRIVDENGTNVTDQYSITEDLGTLTVHPLLINLMTASAQKTYDGTPLTANEWEHISGSLLEGHELSVKCITKVTEVGTFENKADVMIYDQKGTNVSELYQVSVKCGILTVSAIPLHIVTGSITKEYDGTPLVCENWNIASGALREGDNITLISSPRLYKVGTTVNKLTFAITDQNGTDVTHRYQIMQDAGTLSVTPRAITIRTGSASKVYDGSALVCEEYEITKGSLCEGERAELAFTSIVNIGYTQNYIIDCSIFGKDENGTVIDVSSNYRISYDYGTLTVTSK